MRKGWTLAIGLAAVASLGCGGMSRSTDHDCQGCGGVEGLPPERPISGTRAFAGSSSTPAPGASGASTRSGETIGSAGSGLVAFDPQCEQPLGFKSECSFEGTCRELGCGDGISRFGADGCRRECVQTSDCGAGQRCRFGLFSADCGPGSVVEGCGIDLDGSCACSTSADCGHPDICVDATRFPKSLDCVFSGASCGDLADLARRLNDDSSIRGDEKYYAIGACHRSILDQQIALACPGTFNPQCPVPLEFKSECSFEDTCKALGCGDGTSQFGADGCQRLCETSADCGAGERCRFTLLLPTPDDEECNSGSEIEHCSVQEGVCQCSHTFDCVNPGVCVDAAQYPPTLDCAVAGVSCQGLHFMEGNVADAADDGVPEKSVPAKACLDKVHAQQQLLDCPQ